MTAEHPEDWTPRGGAFTQDALEIALGAVDDEADERKGEFAAGMRFAEQLFEEALRTHD
jgi:hypothetical protein